MYMMYSVRVALICRFFQTLEVQVSDTRIMEQPVIQDSLIMTTTNSSPLCTPSQPPTKRSSSGSNSNTPALSKIALHFVHFREERIETLLYSVCQLLGRYGNLQVVVDHLMDLYRSSEGQRKELLIILSRVLTGAKTAQTEVRCDAKVAVIHHPFFSSRLGTDLVKRV